jgi:hypothetical protein
MLYGEFRATENSMNDMEHDAKMLGYPLKLAAKIRF